jgi:sulfite exporter TauE/SafE
MGTFLFLGFLLGLRHAADPDHLAAVGTIVARQQSLREAARVGILWGLGHTGTILLAGGMLLGSRAIVPRSLELALEFGVGAMLVVLGLGNLMRSSHTSSPFSPARALGVGVAHGLAGTGAVVLLVAALMPELHWGLLYLAAFGAGTIAGMLAMTGLLATPAVYAARRAPHLGPRVRLVAGAASVAVGVLLMHEVGVAQGLFGAVPAWTAR